MLTLRLRLRLRFRLRIRIRALMTPQNTFSVDPAVPVTSRQISMWPALFSHSARLTSSVSTNGITGEAICILGVSSSGWANWQVRHHPRKSLYHSFFSSKTLRGENIAWRWGEGLYKVRLQVSNWPGELLNKRSSERQPLNQRNSAVEPTIPFVEYFVCELRPVAVMCGALSVIRVTVSCKCLGYLLR